MALYAGGSPAAHHHGGSLLGNLLSDVVSTAKGIPVGLVDTVRHPIRMGRATFRAEKAMYSPLVHGHFGTFWHNFHDHPLAPLLDATAVLSLGAGAAGVGLRALSAGAEEGSALARAGELVRPGTAATTKELPTNIAGHHELVHFSTNLFRRSMQQKPFEAAMHVASHAPGLRKVFGEGGVHDLTALGRGERKLAQRASEHAAGARNAQARQVIAARRVAKRGGLKSKFMSMGEGQPSRLLSPGEQFAHAIYPGMEKSVFEHSLKVDPAVAQKVPADSPWGYIPAKQKEPIFPKSLDPAHIAEWSQNIGAHWKGVRDPRKALRGPDGKLMLVHREIPAAVGKETANAYRALHAIYHSPTKVWKWLVLANAPRYFVNNLVGQTLMLAMAHNPVALSKGIYHAIHDVHGANAAERAAGKVAGPLAAEQRRLAGTWQHKWYLGAHTGAFGELERAGEKGVRAGARHGLYGVTEKLSYTGHRMVGINVAMMEHPEFQAIFRKLRSQGLSRTEAFRKAADKASADPAVRSFVEKRSSDWAGQYHHSNGLENMLRHVVPFYSWDRHAMRFAKEQVLERPGPTAALAALGREGTQHDQKVLGDLPDFLQGAIPVHGHAGGILGAILGGAVPGRKKVILTAGVNPLAAAAEDTHSLAALFGAKLPAEAIGSQLNPMISGAITGITGQRLATGARVHHRGGVLGSAVAESFGQLPQLKLIQTAIHGNPSTQTKKGNPTLYTHDLHSQLASIFGVPVRDVNQKAARKLFNQQNPGHHKGRRGGHRSHLYAS